MRFFKKYAPLFFLILALSAFLSVSALAADDPGINVQVNNETVSFTDAAPSARGGRVFVPFRAVFEALGAQVSYQAETQTVTAVRGDTTVSFVIGQNGMTVTNGNGTRTVETDAASYAENSRVRVPVRFAAEALGCNVGWDNDTRTVLVLDTDSILGANDATYTLMDRYLAFSQKYQKSPYAIAGTFNLSMKITADGQTIPFVTNATISGLCDEQTANMDVKMAIDLTDLVAASGGELDEQSQQMLALLQNTEIEYIVNLSDGMLYMRSPLFSLVFGATDSNTWFSIDLSQMMDGYDQWASLASTTDFETYVHAIVGMMPPTDTQSLTDTAEMLYMINSAYCDSSFVQSGDTYVKQISYAQDDVSAQGTIVFGMKNDEIVSVDMSLTMDSEDFTVDYTYSLDENGVFDLTMSMTMPDEFEMTMQYHLTYTETDELPVGAPEDGSTIIPLDSMSSSMAE